MSPVANELGLDIVVIDKAINNNENALLVTMLKGNRVTETESRIQGDDDRTA